MVNTFTLVYASCLSCALAVAGGLSTARRERDASPPRLARLPAPLHAVPLACTGTFPRRARPGRRDA